MVVKRSLLKFIRVANNFCYLILSVFFEQKLVQCFSLNFERY